MLLLFASESDQRFFFPRPSNGRSSPAAAAHGCFEFVSLRRGRRRVQLLLGVNEVPIFPVAQVPVS